VFSKAYIDYSTSGLENPLTHLLIVLFFIVYFNYSCFHLFLVLRD
jgi:arabinofuranosyltransferase